MKKAVLVIFAALISINAMAWKPQPWRQYIIEQKVKADTVAGKSIMVSKIASIERHNFNPNNFRIGAIYVPDPPSLFAEYDEMITNQRIATEGYHTSDFVADLLGDIITCFFDK